MYSLLRRALFTIEPERAHALTLSALQLASNCHLLPWRGSDPSEAISLMGLRFPNRIGLAAGFDKDGRSIDALGALGFGFIEVGTVTPLAQSGQPRPRLFRWPARSALINRMGFPNEGGAACGRRLQQRRYRGICGVNIGKNATTSSDAAIDDYVTCYRMVAPHADYVAVNVSSPNTPGLRSLQQLEYLRPILEALIEERNVIHAASRRPIPLLLKVSPDLSNDELKTIAQALLEQRVDGLIATNTTLARPCPVSADSGTLSPQAQAGGLSGAPLRPMALQAICSWRKALGADFPIIGVGGVASSDDAVAMLDAGADLIQIYTGLIYRGPSLVGAIRAGLKHR